MLLYALSKDSNFFDLTLTLLETVEIHKLLFEQSNDLIGAIEQKIPFAVLFDYENLDADDIISTLGTLESRFPADFIMKILFHEEDKSKISKPEFINLGIDVFLNKPVNMLELLAYLCSAERQHLKFASKLKQEIQASIIDTVTRLNDHLGEHVKEPVQRFIDFKLSRKLNEREIKEYLVVSRRSAVEVLAAIQAVKDELQLFVGKSSNYNLENLSELFNKNLALTQVVYGTLSKEGGVSNADCKVQ